MEDNEKIPPPQAQMSADSNSHLVKGYIRQADKLFMRLQTPFGYIESMREKDVHEISSALLAAHITGRRHEKDVTLEKRRKDIDEEIERIVADETPVTEADRTGILECKLAFVKADAELLSKALLEARNVMVAYRNMGYGDEVYIDTLCKAIRQSELSLIRYGSFAEDEGQTLH